MFPHKIDLRTRTYTAIYTTNDEVELEKFFNNNLIDSKNLYSNQANNVKHEFNQSMLE